MKYLYFLPNAGFNDILSTLYHCIQYCKKYKRVLLFDTLNSLYKINFSDYFDISELKKVFNVEIISDINFIKSIQVNESTTFYPEFINSNIYFDIVNGNIDIDKSKQYNVDVNIKLYPFKFHLMMNNNNLSSDFIIYTNCVGDKHGFSIFKNLIIKPVVTDYCKSKYLELKHPYVSFQIRNTDYQSDYKNLLNNNVKYLQNASNPVYVATDCKEVIEYFKSKNINVVNYCHYPDNILVNLHSSEMDPETKLLDLFTDILVLSMSSTIISNSKGGFIKLVQNCNQNKNLISKMFNINNIESSEQKNVVINNKKIIVVINNKNKLL